MSDGFQVNLELLDDVVIRLSNLVGFVQESLDDLDGRMNALPASWTGPAAEAHAAAHAEWMDGAKELHEGIDTMHAAAKQAHEQYSAGASANRRMFGS